MPVLNRSSVLEKKKPQFCLYCWLLFQHLFSRQRKSTVAIVPFKVNAEKDMSFLRDGVYDMLSTRLTKEGEVEVLNRQTVEKALPATSAR